MFFTFQIKEQKVIIDELSNLKKNRVSTYRFAFGYSCSVIQCGVEVFFLMLYLSYDV